MNESKSSNGLLTPTELLAKRRESQDYFSGRLSDQSRMLCYGLAAAGLGLLSTYDAFHLVATSHHSWLILAATAGVCGALLDYLQMLAGWQSATLSASNADGGYAKTPSALRWDRFQLVCFYTKQVFAVAGTVILIVAILITPGT